MRVLHLTLYKEWFDEIRDGTKTEEFRTIKPYWIKRLRGRQYDEVWFRNGYQHYAPFMRVQCEGITEEEEFIIKLGKIIEAIDFPDEWAFKSIMVGEPYKEYLTKQIKGNQSKEQK